ncbi:MAG: DNA-3-methyladenine glycosylase 2 family protein [Thalassovita sp.]
MSERVITSDACVAEGVAWLCAHDEGMARANAITGPLPLRLKPDGFGEVLSAIVSQQVSVASANAIWAKLVAADLTSAPRIATKTQDELRAVGLSRQKARYALALAEAGIDYDALRCAPTETVIKTLTAVTGIGVWTAEIYAKFSLGRADVFASGDLALQEGAKLLYALPERPKDKEVRKMAERWSPWRSVAARQLWAYYHVMKQRDGIR